MANMFSRLANLLGSTTGIMGDVTPSATGNVTVIAPKGKGAALVAPTDAQMAQAYAAGMSDRIARDALVALVKTTHAEGRAIAPLQARFIMGRTVHLVPAIAALGLTSLEVGKCDMVRVAQLYDAELKKPTPRKGETPEACEARGGRNPAFHRAVRSAETVFVTVKHEAEVMEGAEGEGRRKGEGKGRPKGTPKAPAQVNEGKVEGEGNVPANPTPTPDAPEAAPEAAPVTPKAVSNLAASRQVADDLARIMAFIEANPETVAEAIRVGAIEFANVVNATLATQRKRTRK